LKPFILEQTYRQEYEAELFDLSSSSPPAPMLKDLMSPDDIGRMVLGYGRGGGPDGLRRAVARLYPGLTEQNVVIAAGGLEAIRAVAMALIPPGARVAVQAPVYGAVEQALLDQGARLVPLCACPGLAFDLADLAAPTDLAFLNSPYSPGGLHVRGLGNFPNRLIVDEVYRPIELVPGTLRPSVVEASETAVAIGDLSKPLGLGGLRIGWIASRDETAIDACAAALDYLSGSVATPSAFLAEAALDRFEPILAGHTERARRNLSLLTAFVERHRAWIDWTPPQAGFTALLRLSGGPLPAESLLSLRDDGVFLLPGRAIGYEDCIRIGLAGNPELFRRALDLLGRVIRTQSPMPQVDGTADVILLTRAPRTGFGKSRLAASIGPDAASCLAAAFLQDSTDRCLREAARFFVAVDPPEAVDDMEARIPVAEVFGQRGETFGDRLRHAFAQAFGRGARRPVLIGSDSPTLPGHLLSQAARLLDDFDVVLGPALDGGYYAIGLRQPQPGIFDGIEWSTPRVLAQTLERCRHLGLEVFCLPYWYDVDTAEDLERLRADPLLGPHSARALATLDQ
jgi:rSAM/selenodomain-associated transferase 1